MKQTRAVSLRKMVASAVIMAALATPYMAAPAAQAAGSTYYVATAGNDSNPGTADRPWRTIQKAANVMLAGDACTVLAGSYGERVWITRSGSSSAPITFRANGTVMMKGFTVDASYIIITGFDIAATDNDGVNGEGVFLRGSYCTVENNYIHDCVRGGLTMEVEPRDSAARSGCIVRNNRFYRNALAGIEVFGRNHLIEGNEIWGTIQYHPLWLNPPSWVDADGMHFFGTGHVIRGNYIHDISYRDVENVSPHIDCFQTWGPAYDIVFERNVCVNLEYLSPYANGQGFMIEKQQAPVQNLIIRNNVIQAYRPMQAINCNGLAIENNTLTSALTLPASYQFGIQLTTSPNAKVRNNIFYDNPRVHLEYDSASASGLVRGYNCVYRSDGATPQGSAAVGDLWKVDPMFVNAAAKDLSLQASSRCIDAGTALPDVTEDIDGINRPQAAGYDIGAYEYQGSGPLPTATPSSTPTATSTAVVNELVIDDTDDGFATVSSQDGWTEYVETGGQHYGGSHVYNHVLGAGLDKAIWSFTVPRPGAYEVYAWWWAGDWRPSNAPYTVQHSQGATTVRVNQQTNGAQWNLLGAFDFQTSGSVTLSDDAAPGQDVAADAIRLVYVGTLPPPSPTPAPMESTVTLQQGNGGYSGAKDTHMEQYNATTNFSGQDAFRVGYKQTLAGLLQFDVSPVPQGALISTAQLQVYATGWGGVNIGIGAYAVSRRAELSQVTWNQASTGQAWGLAGCNDTSTDRRAAPESTITTNGINQWYGFDVTALVQQWVNGGFVNNGVLLRQTTTAAYRFLFAASEKSDVSVRPRLVVTYSGGGSPAPSATPTATTPATATPTATRTASATPTATIPATATPTATTVASVTPTPVTPATATPTATMLASATPTPVIPATATPTATTVASATPTATTTATATPTAYGVETTVTLRQGNAGYNGAQDAWISADAPGSNYEGGDLLKIGYRQKYAPLVRFDLSSIPAGSTVTQATLQVWATGWSGANLSVAAHAVLRHVVGSQVTWSQASAGNPWGLPGCNDVATDRRMTAESALTTAGIRKWYAFDLTSLVQEWVSGGLDNEGVLLRQSVSAERSMWFASAENPVPDIRPKLVVTYR